MRSQRIPALFKLCAVLAAVMVTLVVARADTEAAPTMEVKKLTASDAEDWDDFGYSVAIGGDTAVIGADGEDGAGETRGATYVFRRGEGGASNWGEVKKLTASDTGDGDLFGVSVAFSEITAVVGAAWEDGAGTDRGAAYVFDRDHGGVGNWGEVKKLTASDAEDEDDFGWSVAVSEDTAIVGARWEAGTTAECFYDCGAAYVFERNQGGAGNWGEVKKLTASDRGNGDRFGWSVAVSGATAVVGADEENGAGVDRGAAYVFDRDQGGADNWGEVKKLTASDGEDLDYFGHTVALAGDTAIVGASGAAYVFRRDEGGADNWGELKKLTASDAEDALAFGWSASVSGDTVIVGAPYKDGAGSNRGAAYIFQRDWGGTDNWGEVTKLTASDAQDGDNFGQSVAVSEDAAVVGADGVGVSRGAAYVFGPAPVGGIAELPDLAAAPAETGGSSGSGTALIAALALPGAVALGSAVWYVRKRLTWQR